MSDDLLTIDMLLAEVEARGMRIEFKLGSPRLAGKTSAATPALVAVLKRRRDEVAARMFPTVKLREWKWPSGMTFREWPEHAAEDAGQHPEGATHWRYVGELNWREIRR